jgi:ArsR family transcriptional regulator
MLKYAINSPKELAERLRFLGNEQRLRVLKCIATKEKYAIEISRELGISRPLVNIYLKQLEEKGLVEGRPFVSEKPPYFVKYYRAKPFELIVSRGLLKGLKEE